MIEIEVNNIYGKILSPRKLDKKLSNAIHTACSFMVAEPHVVQILKKRNFKKYRNFTGWRSLYDRGNGKFRRGLLNKIKEVIEKNGCECNILFTGELVEIPQRTDWSHNIDLRYYQKDCIEAIKRDKHCLISLPTGTGKTFLAIAATVELGVKTMFLTNSRVLMDQARSRFEEVSNIDVGIIGDGVFEPKDFNVAMVQTLGCALNIKVESNGKQVKFHDQVAIEKREDIKAIVGDTRLLIFDESHGWAAETAFELTSCFVNANYSVGLSATNYRADGKDMMLEAAGGPIAYHMSMSKAIEEKWILRPHIVAQRVTKTSKIFDTYHETDFGNIKYESDDYTKVIKLQVYENEDRHKYIANLARVYSKYGPGLISVDAVKHGKALKKYVSNCDFIYGRHTIEQRNKAFKRLRTGKVKCVISNLLKEGFDEKSVTWIILAHPHKDMIQRIGRSVRLDFDNLDKIPYVIHIVDDCYYLLKHYELCEKKYKDEDHDFKVVRMFSIWKDK